LPARITKIRKARSFPYNENLEAHFQILDAKYGANRKYLFPSPVNPGRSIGRDGFATAWQTCKRRAGVVGKFHWLRHSALTRAFRSGKNPALICQVAGLDIKMAQSTYLHFEPEDCREVLI
jgi:hypothetical protein